MTRNRLILVIAASVPLVLILIFLLSPDEATTDGEAPAPLAQGAQANEALVAAPTGTDEPDAGPEEEPDEIDETYVAAREPEGADDFALGTVDAECDVEPALESASAVLRMQSWPGPGRWNDPRVDAGSFDPVERPVDITDGVAYIDVTIPGVRVEDAHLLYEVELVVPGYSPTPFRLLGAGPDGSGRCLDVIRLRPDGGGVVGTVRDGAGVAVEGAVVSGCGAIGITDADGGYLLLPVEERPCAVSARVSMGSAVRSAASEVPDQVGEDIVLDFVVKRPERPELGLQTHREGDEFWVYKITEDSPYDEPLRGVGNAMLLSVGEVDVSDLSDDEIITALDTLSEPLTFQQRFETEDGEEVIVKETIEANSLH